MREQIGCWAVVGTPSAFGQSRPQSLFLVWANGGRVLELSLQVLQASAIPGIWTFGTHSLAEGAEVLDAPAGSELRVICLGAFSETLMPGPLSLPPW